MVRLLKKSKNSKAYYYNIAVVLRFCVKNCSKIVSTITVKTIALINCDARRNSLPVDWKRTVFFFSSRFICSMPIHPISVTFFFTVHSFCEYVQSNQSNTRDRKKPSQEKQTFFSVLFSFFRASLSSLLSKESMMPVN